MNARKLLSAANAFEPAYIEDVFSTYLYIGTGSTQTITNGINLSGKGGMLWIKSRSTPGTVQTGVSIPPNNHYIFDTNRTNQNALNSVAVYAQDTSWGSGYINFLSNGFNTGSINGNAYTQAVNNKYYSSAFRRAPKFFDVVTYTGNGANRLVSHSLGSVPGCIIIKRLDAAGDWQVYHRSIANTEYLVLNTTAAKATGATRWNSTTPTASAFSLGTDTTVNANTGTYVAYLFAHDAGGFGASGSDNAISCGSYTGNSSSQSINIGYEPQWIFVKNITNVSNWQIIDVMRGMSYTSFSPLYANIPDAETTGTSYMFEPTVTGWNFPNAGAATYNTAGNTYIYIAIRRGPMKPPTIGTSVFFPGTYTGTGAASTASGIGFPIDLIIPKSRNVAGTNNRWTDRLRGVNWQIISNSSAAEVNQTGEVTGLDSMNGFFIGTGADTNQLSQPYASWNFRRAPGFFDVVCYDGDGTTNRALSHNLGVVPELLIGKNRDSSGADFNWQVGSPLFSSNQVMQLNLPSGLNAVGAPFGTTAATSTQFRVGADASNSYIMNRAGQRYVTYLFATVAGVSKVGTYTGTGNTLQINCGFTGGARFVLIKATSTTGDWLVWDSARGIVAGNDPYLELNTTDAEVTTTDWVDVYGAGFELSNAGANLANTNGTSYIFLAVA